METINYAQEEFNKYFFLVTGEKENSVELNNLNTGNVFDDDIKIEIICGKGKINGSNARAVLIGVYKFFYCLGCRFIRPGKDGEILVKKGVLECTVRETFKPKHRYRGISNEGAISEDNITEMVEWLPKVGMNSYFIQFIDGHLFFEKWYEHKESTVLKSEQYSVKDSRKHYENAVETIKKCGLIFQAVGHGWTTEPLGYVTYGDNRSKDEDITAEDRELFAEVKGKRGFFNAPGDTHLCYSNKKARNIVTNGITNYLIEHPNVDILHFWLADGINNHCECENCKKHLPSEWYVTMLNELDAKLTENKIATKVVFLIYCDLLFAPKSVKINNTKRFIMMYAPIARDFFNPLYTEENIRKATIAPSYERNKNSHPKNASEYLYYLNEWRKTEESKCDSFAFDYHLMTFQYGGEPSFTRISRTLYEDMNLLEKVGLNGNISCQLQRIFLPTSLPMYVMAERLFGSNRSFDEIENECLNGMFGEQSEEIKKMLHLIEAFYLQDFMCGKAKINGQVLEIEKHENELNKLFNLLNFNDENATIDLSLRNLKYFIETEMKLLSALKLKASDANYEKEKQELIKHIDENELKVQPYEDSLFKKECITSWL